MMFGHYIRNNIGVAFQCFAGGLFAGLGSIFFLAFNGAFGGAIAGYLTGRGLGSTFYSFIVTHAAFELTAIVLAGAAGLRIGHSLMAPGRQTRVQSLIFASRQSVVLLYGVFAMLVVAAVDRSILVIGHLASGIGEVRRRRLVLDRRARIFHAPGPPCSLIPSRCG